MDERKAFGVITAAGKRIGEAARAGNASPLERARGAPDVASLVALLREASGLPAPVVDAFAEWAATQPFAKLRAQFVLQAKMHAAGGAPAPGHEAGRGNVKGKSG